jgi:hypothetical protein
MSTGEEKLYSEIYNIDPGKIFKIRLQNKPKA